MNDHHFVTVFGAGIAGLTAAHELVTRGFQVEVIDPAINEHVGDHTLDRGIGGMARSQWVCAVPTGDPGMTRLWPASELVLDETIVFDPQRGLPVDPSYAASIVRRIATAARALHACKCPVERLSIVAPVPRSPAGRDARLDYMRAQLRAEIPELVERLAFEERVTTSEASWRSIFVDTSFAKLPAEHGFRFFPSFYRHLFDTMKRTPIARPRDGETERRSVFDNLVSSEVLGFGRAGGARSFPVPRRRVASFEAVRDYLELVLGELEYSLSDVARFQLKLFKYMTSSVARRRAEYEHVSWGKFVEEHLYSSVSRRHIETGPQMSAALRGSKTDARTYCNITVQLLLDQLRESPLHDGTLDGPTSTVWFDHWKDFLERQGVAFRRGRLVGFESRDSTIVPIVERRDRLDGDPPQIGTIDVRGSYFVLALSLPEIYALADRFTAVAYPEMVDRPDADHDFARIKRFAGPDLERDLERADPTGPLQHLSGIQYYFDTDVRFWRGHTQYLDSEWGLTSIAQTQFWAKPREPGDAYRSILSVDIGTWDQAYREAGAAWSLDRHTIAELAWAQIEDHHESAYRAKYGDRVTFPRPVAYALDPGIVFGEPKRDRTPFLVNRTSAYKTRPGAIAEAEHGAGDEPRRVCESRYTVHAGRYVLAGTFMQTYTRLTSMEGANESARHAVNALLASWGATAEPCEIWDPEDHELPDLRWLKELDRELHARRLPHFVDILGWRALPDRMIEHHVRELVQLVRPEQ